MQSSKITVRIVRSRRMISADNWRRGRGVQNILVGESEKARPLGRHRRFWEDNIKIILQEIGRERVDWIHLAEVGTSSRFW